jgi:hypothetical protein
LIETIRPGGVSLRNCLLNETQTYRGTYRQRDGNNDSDAKGFMGALHIS